MPSVFISYRRSDSSAISGRIHEHLVRALGKENVFKDVDSIPPGVDFRKVVGDSVALCDVLLAVIGVRWLGATDAAGQDRLSLETDFVRLEIEAALKRDIPVIPVLVEGASVPTPDQLPPSLRDLAYRHASVVRNDPDFNHDMDRLIRALKRPIAPPAGEPVKWKAPAAVMAGVLALGATALSVFTHRDPVLVSGRGLEAPLAPAETPKSGPVPAPSPSQPAPDPPARGETKADSTVGVIPTRPQRPDSPAKAAATGTIPDEGTRPGQERDDNALKMTFSWCPAGSFKMGSPPDEPERQKNEGGKDGKQVDVSLIGFWMGKYEVTQSQWQQVMGTSVRDQMAKAGSTSLSGEGPDHPIYCVSHAEVEEFCRKLTKTERAAGHLPAGWEYRLPTEAEWEYACRAGTTTPFAFGERLSTSEANFDGNFTYNGSAKGEYLGRTAPVGSYRPNAWGLFDMHGNVWEWCRDGYAEALPGGVGLTGPEGASHRVNRGGSWSCLPLNARAAYRFGYTPGERFSDLGFRLARGRSGL
jgi:formylglycine-generating enzyme required for sulfatase activity